MTMVGGFQGCSRDKQRNNWLCARAVRKCPLKFLWPIESLNCMPNDATLMLMREAFAIVMHIVCGPSSSPRVPHLLFNLLTPLNLPMLLNGHNQLMCASNKTAWRPLLEFFHHVSSALVC